MSLNKKPLVIITGGHATAALAVIDELKKYPIRIIFIGRRYTNNNNQLDSFEYKAIKSKDINFYHLSAGRINRFINFSSLIQMLFIPIGIIHAFKILKQLNPHLVLSFGGYLGATVSLAAFSQRIPVFIHEQTLIPGWANRFTACFAKKIFISFSETIKYFPTNKVITSGNPLRPEIYHKGTPVLKDFSKPLILITGGQLGAHSINKLIEPLIDKLTLNFILLHQTGNTAPYYDYNYFSKRKSSCYHPVSHLTASEMSWALTHASLVISRSGANIINELIYKQVPSILIPLPWSACGEQLAQARLLANAGAAIIFDQNQSSDLLLNIIEKVYFEKDIMRAAYSKLSSVINPQAAKIIAKSCLLETLS